MACTASFFSRYPTGGTITVNCPPSGNVLPGTYGDIATSCRPSKVRAKVNGGAPVTSAVGYVQMGGSYFTTWNLANVPGVICSTSNPNQLVVEVEVTDPVSGAVSWIASNPVNFYATCMMSPPPPRAFGEKHYYMQLPVLYPPSLLWGMVEGKLVATQIVTFKRVDEKRDVKKRAKPLAMSDDSGIRLEWKSTGQAEGLWTLTLGGNQQARLRLVLPAKFGGTTYRLEFMWGSCNFTSHKGGLFGPIGNNILLQTLTVTATKGSRMKPKSKGGKKKQGARR
jgi:hypothetical protein